MYRFISKDRIEKSNSSSEWIKIDLPGDGDWLTITFPDNYLEHLENIYKEYLYNLREIKLKKII
jgi:hypothetical protein